MSKKQNRIALLTIAMALFMVIGAQAEKVTLTAWAWPGADKEIQSVLSDYAKINPDVTINVVAIENAQLHQKLQVAIAAGSGGPDISYVEGAKIQRFIRYGGFVDVTEIVKPLQSDMFPYKNAEAMDENGHIFAFPTDIGPVVLYYNKELLDKYSLKPPLTWDDFVATGIKLKAKGVSMIHFSNNGDEGLFNVLLQQAGGNLFSPDGKVTFNTPQTEMALNMYLKIYKSGIGANVARDWSPAMFDALKMGNVATYAEALWMTNVFIDNMKTPAEGFGKWRAQQLPALVKGQVSGANNGGSQAAVLTMSAHQKEAIEFLKYETMSIAAQRTRAAFGIVPPTVSALQDPQIVGKKYDFYGGQNVMALALTAAKNIKIPVTALAALQEARQAVTDEMPKLMRGEIAVKDFMVSMQAKLEGIAKKY
jgi:ABC-type glycerol-3-phosphate transport system substrate-binding protein